MDIKVFSGTVSAEKLSMDGNFSDNEIRTAEGFSERVEEAPVYGFNYGNGGNTSGNNVCFTSTYFDPFRNEEDRHEAFVTITKCEKNTYDDKYGDDNVVAVVNVNINNWTDSWSNFYDEDDAENYVGALLHAEEGTQAAGKILEEVKNKSGLDFTEALMTGQNWDYNEAAKVMFIITEYTTRPISGYPLPRIAVCGFALYLSESSGIYY